MSNFKLTDLNTITESTASDILYIVQGNVSKSITIESLVSNLPSNINTSGEYLSGTETLATGLGSFFAAKDSIQYEELQLTVGSELFDLTNYSNYTVALSTGVSRINVPVPTDLPDGFAIKLIQTGTQQIVLSAAAGVTIDSSNSSLSSGGQYETMELYKQPIGNDRFLLGKYESSNVNSQTVTVTGNVTTSALVVNSLSAQNSIITNDIIGSESNDSLQLKSDPEAPDGTNGGAQIELYSQDFTAVPSQIYHKARFHTFQDLLGNNTVVIDSDSGNVTTNEIFVSSLSAQNSIITNDIIGSESNDSLQLKSDPEAPDGTNGGAQIELYSQDFTAVPSQIYHKARFHTFQDLLGNNTVIIDSDSGNVIIPNIATSPTGLSSGTIYSDGGTLKIVS